MELPIVNRIVKGQGGIEIDSLYKKGDTVTISEGEFERIDGEKFESLLDWQGKILDLFSDEQYIKEEGWDRLWVIQDLSYPYDKFVVSDDNIKGKTTKDISSKTEQWEERWHKHSSQYPARKPTMEDIEIRKEDIRDYATLYWKSIGLSNEEITEKKTKLESDMGMAGRDWKDWYYKLGEMSDYYKGKYHSIKTAQYSPSSPKTPRMQEHHFRMEKDMVSGPESPKVPPQSKMEKDITKTPTGFHNADIVVTGDEMLVNATGEADQDYDHEFYNKIVAELDGEGFPGATHREFDKYQGVYLNVPGVDKFWVRSTFIENDGIAYIMVPEKDMGGRGWEVKQFSRKGTSGLEPTGEINASELIEYCREIKSGGSEKAKQWEERWHKKSELYPERYMGDPRGQMEMPGNVEIVSLTVIPGAKEIPSNAIDRLKPLPSYWYENEEGIKHIPTEEEMHGEPFFPKDFPLQHSLNPEVVEDINYTDDRGHLMTGHKTINCIEPIVIYLVTQKGWKMTDAIVVAAETCERCLNILLEEVTGEPYNERDIVHTHCEQCAIVDPEYDKAFKQHEKEREMGMHHENDAQPIKENNTDLVKESSDKKRERIIAIAKELMFRAKLRKAQREIVKKHIMPIAQMPQEEFKTNQWIIFTQDCRFKMEQMDAVGEIKENMVGKVTNVSDEGITVEIGKQAYRIPYIDAFKVLEPFQAKVISPEQEAKEQGGEEGMEGEELVPEEQPEGGEEPAIARPETTMERGPVPIKAPMKPLEKALQVETVLKGMMRKMGVEDPRKQLAKNTPVNINGKPGKIMNFIGNDYQVRLDNGKVMIVPIEAISTQAIPSKPVPKAEVPAVSPQEAPKPIETPKQAIPEDFPAGSDVWVTIPKEGGFPQHTRGTVVKVEDGKYTVRRRGQKGEIIEADKSQLNMASRPEKPAEEKMPFPPFRYSKRGLAPVYPKDNVPKNTFVYVELEKKELPLYFGRVVEPGDNMLGIEILAEERSDFFPRNQVFYVEMPLAVREQMMEKFKDWTTETEAKVLDHMIVTAIEEGDKEIIIDDRTVYYRYFDDYDGEMNEGDKEHIQQEIVSGVHRGELLTDIQGETHGGWWEVARRDEPADEIVKTLAEWMADNPRYGVSDGVTVEMMECYGDTPDRGEVKIEAGTEATFEQNDFTDNMSVITIEGHNGPIAVENTYIFVNENDLFLYDDPYQRTRPSEKTRQWEERWHKRQEEKMDRVILGTVEISDQMLDDAGMWLSRELWEPKVKEISKEIESLLGQVERGINVAPQIASYVEDLGEILEKIPHAQLIEAGEYLGKLWEEEGKKSPVAFISSYLEVRAGDDMGKKPLKELNKIVKERSKDKLKEQKDDARGGTGNTREVSRDNVHQDINFQSRMSAMNVKAFTAGETVEILTGIHKGETGVVKEFTRDTTGRSPTAYRVRVGNDNIWKYADELKYPEAVPTASAGYKGIVADISAGYRQLMDEIEHSNNPYTVSDIGKKLMKKENKETQIVREGEVTR